MSTDDRVNAVGAGGRPEAAPLDLDAYCDELVDVVMGSDNSKEAERAAVRPVLERFAAELDRLRASTSALLREACGLLKLLDRKEPHAAIDDFLDRAAAVLPRKDEYGDTSRRV